MMRPPIFSCGISAPALRRGPRPHATLTKAAGGYPTTPAMAAGVANHVWTLTEIAALLD